MERREPNRLAAETSPYLLQHAHNPVDWYPWRAEALERAKREDKPIFLSIGYSACHWCHVMERECFEDPVIAELMNACFVNIKVDREERPDIDEIYMKAVVALTGSGGWPMSVFLTPDQKPFFGATYLPPVRRYGRPSFPDVLRSLSQAWNERREDVAQQAGRLTQHILDEAKADLRGALDADVLDRSQAALIASFDPEWGGFGKAPKFPHALDIRMCLRHHVRTHADGDASEAPAGEAPASEHASSALYAAVHTLKRMAAGGIYDQLGGGFHRYSTDAQWRIPHFEKMLYDNALLVPAYLEAHLLTRDAGFASIAAECCDWVLREMVTASGGFASAQDADSEGEEGRYFAWTVAQLQDALGEELSRIAASYWNVTGEGNFEHGKSALWLPRSLEAVATELAMEPAALQASIAKARTLLLAARKQRIAPATDDKVLVAWNGLMISALALAHQALDEPRYLEAARTAARHVLTSMRKPDGALLATSRGEHAHLDACLDDYAFMAQACLDLYESDFDLAWLREARALSAIVQARFWDAERGGYFTTGHDHEALIARTKNVHDGALPAGGGVQACNLARLAELTGEDGYAQAAQATLQAYAALVNRHPRLFSQLLMAVDFIASEPRQIVLVGERENAELQRMLRAVRTTFLPARVVACVQAGADPLALSLFEGRVPSSAADAPCAYVCRRGACHAPVRSQAALRVELTQLAR